MALSSDFIKLLEDDFGFRCDVKRLLDIDGLESRFEDLDSLIESLL